MHSDHMFKKDPVHPEMHLSWEAPVLIIQPFITKHCVHLKEVLRKLSNVPSNQQIVKKYVHLFCMSLLKTPVRGNQEKFFTLH